MARPKSNDLPQYVKARVSGDATLYYYQRWGKQIPLGRDYANAESRAAAIVAKPPEAARIESLTAADVLAKAIPALRQSGIYFLILNGEIAYVGQSMDVWARIVQHLKVRRFDSFSWFACPESELDRLEALCIEKFRPWQNDGIRPHFRTRSQKRAATI